MAEVERAVERTIDIVVAEKNPLLQAGLAKLFKGKERFKVVGMVDDGAAFLREIERTRCDVGVIGWEMPNLDGKGVLTAMRGRGGPRVVVYTGSSNPDLPRQAMALGAAGFASKQNRPEQLLETVDAVASGRMAFPFVDVARLSSESLLFPHPSGARAARGARRRVHESADGQPGRRVTQHSQIPPEEPV